MSVTMALVDFLPVVLFLIASLILMRDLYHILSKGAYALMSGGFLTIFMAGFFKALWKLLYALEICDFAALNNAFFPMQTTGFLLAGLGLMNLLWKKKVLYAVPVYTSAMPFVIVMIFGMTLVWGSLASLAGKMKKKGIVILILVSFVCMLGMGYLSSKDFANPLMNWIGEGVNIAGMLLLLLSVLGLHNSGLSEFEF